MAAQVTGNWIRRPCSITRGGLAPILFAAAIWTGRPIVWTGRRQPASMADRL